MLSLILAAALAAANPPPQIKIETRDYTIAMPAHIPAGLVNFTLENHGSEPHEIRFVRLAGKHTFDDFVAWQKSGTQIPDWLSTAGGMAAVGPGRHQEYIMSLEAGTYAVLCSYPSENGTPHTDKGMFAALTVDAGASAAAPPADADITITLTDHHFQLTAPFDGPHPLIHVRNAGTEPHQAQLVRLPDERLQYTERAWFQNGGKGTRPGIPVGGSIEVPVDGEVWFRPELTPGSYLLICAQAEEEGRHFDLGMIYAFVIE
jgi:hypothetical protein